MKRAVTIILEAEVEGDKLPDELLYRLIVETAVGRSSGTVRGNPRAVVRIVRAKMDTITPDSFPRPERSVKFLTKAIAAAKEGK